MTVEEIILSTFQETIEPCTDCQSGIRKYSQKHLTADYPWIMTFSFWRNRRLTVASFPSFPTALQVCGHHYELAGFLMVCKTHDHMVALIYSNGEYHLCDSMPKDELMFLGAKPQVTEIKTRKDFIELETTHSAYGAIYLKKC